MKRCYHFVQLPCIVHQCKKCAWFPFDVLWFILKHKAIITFSYALLGEVNTVRQMEDLIRQCEQELLEPV